MMARRLALLALLGLLAGCRPDPVQPRIGPVQALISQIASGLRATPQERCMIRLGQRSDRLPEAVARQVAGLQGATDTSIDWQAVFSAAAQDAGIRPAGVSLVWAAGSPGQVLAAVEWCFGLAGYDLYGIDLGTGEAERIAEQRGSNPPPDVRWLGNAWAVITDVGSGLSVTRLELVESTDSGWALIFSPDLARPGQTPVYWSSLSPASMTFEDGYRVLRVEWDPLGAGTRVTSVYEWRSGTYQFVGEQEASP